MPKHSYPHTYPPRKRLHLRKTHLLDLPDDLLIRIYTFVQPPQTTLSGRALATPPPGHSLSLTCVKLREIYLDTVSRSLQRLDATTTNRFEELHTHPPGKQAPHIASVINAYGALLRTLRLPRYHTGLHVTPALLAAGKVCRKLESLAFADDLSLHYHITLLLFTQNKALSRVCIYGPSSATLTALTSTPPMLTKLVLYSLKASTLQAVKQLIAKKGGSIRYLLLGFDRKEFENSISEAWKYDPLRPYHELLSFLSGTIPVLLPLLEKLGINLGGQHFADGLDLKFFQELSRHVEIEIHSVEGALSIPAKSGVDGVHFVKSLNLGTIFTGPGTYRIGCPNRIDLSNHGFILKYANGAAVIKERVRSLVKTVVKHSSRTPALLSIHVGISSLTRVKNISKTVSDMLKLVPEVSELEISREIVEYAYDHVHEARYRRMFSLMEQIKLLHLVEVKGCKECTGVERNDKIYHRHKRARLVRALPKFLWMVARYCLKLECLLLDDFVPYDGGLEVEILAGLRSVTWLEDCRPGLDCGTLRGQLESWRGVGERIARGEVVWTGD